jgi:PAS domain S-box-containing protein
VKVIVLHCKTNSTYTINISYKMNEFQTVLGPEIIITEESLLKETERLAHIGSWQFNFISGLGIWSDETFRLLGFKPGEVAPLLESFLKQIHPDDLDRVLNAIEEVELNLDLASKKIEHRVVLNKTNEVRYLFTEIFIERDDMGQKTRAKGFNMDITSKKLAEQKLHQSQAHLLASQRIANVGNWEVDLSNSGDVFENPFYWSDETFRIFGLNPEKFNLTVNNLIERVYPGDRDNLLKRFAYSIETGKIFNCEHRIIQPDNLQRIVHERGEIIFDKESGRALKMIGTIQNITERKQEEESFHKSEANLRTILDNTSSVYLLVNRDLKLVSFNKAALERFNRDSNKILNAGDNIIDFVSEDRQQRAMEMYQRVFDGEQFKMEDSYTQKDGTIIWYYMQLLPVYGENNKVLNMVIYLMDITDRKKAELERDKITSDLMQRNTDLEQFSCIISHNLRQPIANILGLANNYIFNELPENELRDVISALGSSAKRMDEVIRDLTHILGVRNGERENKQVVKLCDVLNDTKTGLGYLIKKENVIIETNFTDADELFTIKSYVSSVFYNLILNSIKYRRSSLTPVVRINYLKENNKILLSFKDNGLGIDLSKKQNELFGLYKRFHTHVEGKGMGLFMVKAQVEAMGGKISAISEVDKGTVFTIELKQ